jgi:hypothetical protein
MVPGFPRSASKRLHDWSLDEADRPGLDVADPIAGATGQVRPLSIFGTFDLAVLEDGEVSAVHYLQDAGRGFAGICWRSRVPELKSPP